MELLSAPVVSDAPNGMEFPFGKAVSYDICQRYRLAARVDADLGLLGNAFLQNNWERSMSACDAAATHRQERGHAAVSEFASN